MIFQDPISSLNPRRKVRDIVIEPLEHLEDRHEGGAPGQGPPGAGGRRARPRRRRRPPAPPVLRRPVPAHLHRPGARARPEADHLRRAGVGARRQRAGPGAQPARGPEAPLRADADLHRPRPRRRQERQRPRRRDVPRQALRGRRRRRRCTRDPAHPYTDVLLKSIPVPDPTVRPDPNSRIEGEIPSPVFPPSGCRFRTRCPRAQDRCALEEPIVRAIEPDHFVACHFPLIGETAPPVASNGATNGAPPPGPSGRRG